jgi:hypothetical protein
VACFSLYKIDQNQSSMNRGLIRLWGIIATAAVICILPAAVCAAMIATDQAGVSGAAAQDRATVQGFIDRADAWEKLQAMGVDGLTAKGRVAALTDQEVHALAQRIDALPAGGNLGTTDIIVILLVATPRGLVDLSTGQADGVYRPAPVSHPPPFGESRFLTPALIRPPNQSPSSMVRKVI